MYYIEGIIDSLEITTKPDAQLEFTLLPSSEFLKTMEDGTKMALFVKKGENPISEDNKKWRFALLSSVAKNEREKEVLKFQLGKPDSALKCLLLEAKNNRNTLQVLAMSNGEKPEELRIDFSKSVSITIL